MSPNTIYNHFESCPPPPSRHLLSHAQETGLPLLGESVLVNRMSPTRGPRCPKEPRQGREPSKSQDVHAGSPTGLTSVRAEGTFFCFLKVEGLMLWKTDEKELLEKRGEDRGKLMLTGLSVTKTSYGEGR